MKKLILSFLCALLVPTTIVPTSTTNKLTIKKKLIIARNCALRLAQVGAGVTTSAISLPFLGIGLVGTNFKKIADQEPTLLYELNNEGRKVEAGKAKYVCNFFAFREITSKIINEETNQEEDTIKYMPVFINNNILHPVFTPISPEKLAWVDTGTSIAKKTGFIIGLPLFIAGLTTIKSGIEGIYKEIKQLKK
jgi:hypothetical protein